MEVVFLEELNNLENVSKNINLVLGLFDGLHVGHVQLIRTARYFSNGKLAVITFDKTLKSNDHSVLLNLEDKIKGFEDLEVDEVYIIKCDENFKKMSYLDFINKILKKFSPKKIFCGLDFKFGYKAQGDVNTLKEFFSDVIVLNYVNTHNGSKISSSVIKKMIKEGKIEDANRYLGREYFLNGKVVKGKQNGHQLGYPTLNLKLLDNYVIPQNGVYITKTKVGNGIYYSMTNVGTHPTIDEVNKPLVESYLIDFNENIYNKNVRVYFIKKLRDEIKFSSLEELKNALKSNEEEVKRYFNINF